LWGTNYISFENQTSGETEEFTKNTSSMVSYTCNNLPA